MGPEKWIREGSSSPILWQGLHQVFQIQGTIPLTAYFFNQIVGKEEMTSRCIDLQLSLSLRMRPTGLGLGGAAGHNLDANRLDKFVGGLK
jgi:hypothetical protein